jgi:uncharacterized oligopeptide transporter (OPT) family protein
MQEEDRVADANAAVAKEKSAQNGVSGGAAAPAAPTRKQTPEEIDLEWLRTHYKGDEQPQLTLRAVIMGMFLGAIMALSNLYVGLKAGWGLGVAITSCILSFSIFRLLRGLRVMKGQPSILENNCMQSTASAAGYSTGATLVSAFPAYLMITGHQPPMLLTMLLVLFLAMLGVFMAIPMKRNMINVEQLPFPSGIAAAETLKSLYAEGGEAAQKAKGLFGALGFGMLLAWIRDGMQAINDGRDASADAGWLREQLKNWAGSLGDLAKSASTQTAAAFQSAQTKLLAVANRTTPFFQTKHVPFMPSFLERDIESGDSWSARFSRAMSHAGYGFTLELSTIFIGAGAIMGFRTTWSLLLGAIIDYGILAPIMHHKGVITDLGYRGIVKWAVWPGVAMMTTAALLNFILQGKTILRALSGLGGIFGGQKKKEKSAEQEKLARIEVPTSWFATGFLVAAIGAVVVNRKVFGIPLLLGSLAVLISFVLAIVACRATGETDTTPIGALGKITQLTYGVLIPQNIGANLMTANVTSSVASSSADLLTDLKSGYILGANPRKQFLAQFFGLFAGAAVAVPAFYFLVPRADVLGGNKFPAPAAQVWKAVAELLANGVHSLDGSAIWAMAIGGLVGIVLTLLEHFFPEKKKWIPSPTGMGLAFVVQCWNSCSMFIGGLIVYIWERKNKKTADTWVIPVASGLIAGESLLGVGIAILSVLRVF